MEQKLKLIFDYQRFQPNNRLSALIEQTDKAYCSALSDEDLDLVNAAGEPYADMVKRLARDKDDERKD